MENVYYFDKNFIACQKNLLQQSRRGVDWSIAKQTSEKNERRPRDLSAAFKGFHTLGESLHVSHLATKIKKKIQI